VPAHNSETNGMVISTTLYVDNEGVHRAPALPSLAMPCSRSRPPLDPRLSIQTMPHTPAVPPHPLTMPPLASPAMTAASASSSCIRPVLGVSSPLPISLGALVAARASPRSRYYLLPPQISLLPPDPAIAEISKGWRAAAAVSGSMRVKGSWALEEDELLWVVGHGTGLSSAPRPQLEQTRSRGRRPRRQRRRGTLS
jgi:hypothetical protein